MKPNSEIDKMFDERFTPEWWKGFGTTDDIDKLGINGIKSFIHSIREQDRKNMVEEIEKIRDFEPDSNGRYNACTEIINKLNTLR